MSDAIEVRKLPKKTVVLISVMSLILVVGFLLVMNSKNLKMEEILHSLGYNAITDVKVINKLSVEDKQTKEKSTVYKVAFTKIPSQQECVGFVHRDNKGTYSKDIDCK